VRLAFVVQRYGLEVAGGAELHCRWVAEQMAARHAVEVFTTSALDHTLWTPGYPVGTTRVNALPVHRFPLAHPRDPRRLAALSNRVFAQPHSRDDEEAWVRANGPESPELVDAVAGARERFDAFFFFSYRYYHSYFGLPAVRDKAILVPTAEEDDAVELGVFGELFRSPRAIAYNTPEERALIARVTGGEPPPGAVVGCGLSLADAGSAPSARERFGLRDPYLLYLGRIEPNKGCATLFSYFLKWLEESRPAVDLVLAGKAAMEIPAHPRIRSLGFVSEAEKVGLLAECQALVMPSPYESLSLVLLEAWRMGVPALANGRCRVLRGQCGRSGGGLAYRGFEEFAAAAELLLADPGLRGALGRQGRAYVESEYAWERVVSKLEGLIGA
jgi:glycosyltransferase involved in cell wall biosynthesis